MPRPSKKFSKQDLQEIEILAGLGLTQQQIADVKDICIDTLRKYGIKPYRVGKAKAIAKVSKTAFEMASSGKHSEMTKFYLKTQARWREYNPANEELLKFLKHMKESEKPHED